MVILLSYAHIMTRFELEYQSMSYRWINAIYQ